MRRQPLRSIRALPSSAQGFCGIDPFSRGREPPANQVERDSVCAGSAHATVRTKRDGPGKPGFEAAQLLERGDESLTREVSFGAANAFDEHFGRGQRGLLREAVISACRCQRLEPSQRGFGLVGRGERQG